MAGMRGIRGARRLYPRPWDYSCYLFWRMRKAFVEAINSIFKDCPAVVVVDFGCGEKPYEPLFAGHIQKYIGVDVSRNPKADIIISANDRVPIDGDVADVVLSVQVLEHVVDVDLYLSECWRMLKPGGILLLSTHGFWTYHPYPTDFRRWTCAGLKYDIEKHGFRVQSSRACLGPLAYTTQLRLQLVRGFLHRLGMIAMPLIGLLSSCAQLIMLCEDWITPRHIREENAAVYVIAARKQAKEISR